MPYLTMIDERFVVVKRDHNGDDLIIDADDDAAVLAVRYGTMAFIS